MFISELGRVGLLADIVGAILIARAVFWVKDRDIFDTSAGFLGYSRYHTVEGLRAKYEAIIGSVFLSLGFLGQYVATLPGMGQQQFNYWVDVMMGVIYIILGYLSIIYVHKFAEKRANAFIEAYNKEQQGK